mgnify:CR=1 FL=1
MGKIKGWTKEEEEAFTTPWGYSSYIAWKSEYDGNLLEIRAYGDKNRVWVVRYGLTNWERPNQTGKPLWSRKFKSKDKAIRYAISYMKAHPKGY